MATNKTKIKNEIKNSAKLARGVLYIPGVYTGLGI